MKNQSGGGDLAEAVAVIQSSVRHMKSAVLAWNNRGPVSEAPMAHAMLCLGRDVLALEEIGHRMEQGEIARSKITIRGLNDEAQP